MTVEDVRQMEAALGRIYGPIKKRYRPQGKTMVYFVRAGDLVKIGHARDPLARLEAIRTHNPVAELVAVIPGGISVERELHEKFAGLRFQREWFHEKGELATYIANLESPEQIL